MNDMKLPANCAQMTENERVDTIGGGAADTAVEAVIAIGGAVALTGVAATAVSAIFGGDPFGWIQGSMEAGKNFIDNSVEAGRNFLNSLMGISLL